MVSTRLDYAVRDCAVLERLLTPALLEGTRGASRRNSATTRVLLFDLETSF